MYFQKKRIHHLKSIAYTPEQSGIACTLVEWARAIINAVGLDKRFWAEAVNTANYCKNLSPTVAVNGKTQYEA